MPDVAIVNYGAGNLTSVRQAVVAAGGSARLAASPDQVAAAALLVIPGVGHFEVAASALDTGWQRAIHAHLDRGGLLLGICLGMQWLFEGSDEAPGARGLGAFRGRCARLDGPVKVPHVGWNTLDVARDPSRLLRGVAPGAFVYFTHTYAAPPGPDTVATTTHGLRFSSAVESGRVFGTQFHPEKSGDVGLALLRNVIDLARSAT
jgi:glutamine amidotransferase